MHISKDQCFSCSAKYHFCIEFHLDEHHWHGFPASQLIHYTLAPNPDAEDDKNAPPQKLALAFSTADVVILGWRLGLIAEKLRENELDAVQILEKRYLELDRSMPFVASIKITPIEKQ
jgi:hypothetical protein